MCTGVEIALLTMTAVSAYNTMESQQQQAGAQRRQYEAEQRRAEIQNIRATRQQIRESRLAQASMLNIGAQAGGMDGSALAGGTASVGSQLASNLDYMGQIAAQNTQITTAASQAASAGANAAMWGSLGQFSGTIFREVGGFKAFNRPPTA